jgi:hypothetical protein
MHGLLQRTLLGHVRRPAVHVSIAAGFQATTSLQGLGSGGIQIPHVDRTDISFSITEAVLNA